MLNCNEDKQGSKLEHLQRDFLALLYRLVYFEGFGGVEDYRMETSSFVLVFREKYRASLFGVTDRAADMESGNTGLVLAHLAELSETVWAPRFHRKGGQSK